MRNIKNLQLGRKMIAGLLLTASLLTLPGCGKKSDCNIPEYHLHRYEKEGIVRYLNEEDLKYKGYDRTNDIIYLSYQEQQLREFEQKKNLIRIDENEDYIRKTEENNTDFMEYEYRYVTFVPCGKTLIPITHYSWTTNQNHSGLTGKTRQRHYMYIGYQVVDENGKYKVIESEPVDDLLSIKDDYPYFKENGYQIINKEEIYQKTK